MKYTRELQRLQERVHKISMAKNSPSLRMIVVGANKEIPPDEDELTQWDLICKIQKRPFSR